MQKQRYLIAPFLGMLLVALVSGALADAPEHPFVSGTLTPDQEYDEIQVYPNGTGRVGVGAFSKLYDRYVEGYGWYILNDWYLPEEDYDPDDTCDGYNIFDFTDTGYSPWYKYWRVKVHGDGGITLQTKMQNEEEWTDADTTGWETATSYDLSKNRYEPHPIWELKIPESIIRGNIILGLLDPKAIDPLNCPEGWTPPNYGPATDPDNPTWLSK